MKENKPNEFVLGGLPLQGGLDNAELLAAWMRKLPRVEPSERDLSAFAIGVEVGQEIGLLSAIQAAQPDDSYQDEWFKAKADAVRRIRALMPPTASSHSSGWYFCRMSPTNTLLVVKPNGDEHVVKNGDMNSAAGIALLNAMAEALSGSAPPSPRERPDGYKTRSTYWPPPKSCVK